MQIYFSKREGVTTVQPDFEHYYNMVEFGTNPGGFEEISIQDDCDRYIPIRCEDIPKLISALDHVYSLYLELQKNDLLKQQIRNDVHSI